MPVLKIAQQIDAADSLQSRLIMALGTSQLNYVD
jgi:hypothetical protein